jgi:hypothetical protein
MGSTIDMIIGDGKPQRRKNKIKKKLLFVDTEPVQ